MHNYYSNNSQMLNASLQRRQDELNGESGGDDSLEKEADEAGQKIASGDEVDTTNFSSADQQTMGKSEEKAAQLKQIISGSLQGSKGGGEVLKDKVKSDFESSMNTDLSDIRIHTDAGANKMNEDINARAFTHGSDIYFKRGNYDPETKEGKELLGHELAHTQQQGKGVRRKVQRQVEDPEIKFFSSVKEGINPAISEMIDYYGGNALTSPMGEVMSEYPLKVQITTSAKIESGDPEGIAYTDYLNQIYEMDYETARQTTDQYLAQGSKLWKSGHFSAVAANSIVTISLTPALYLSHLMGTRSSDRAYLFEEHYLIQKSREGGILKDNVETINRNLKLLSLIPPAKHLLSQFKGPILPVSDLTEVDLPELSNEIVGGYKPELPDNTYVDQSTNQIQLNEFDFGEETEIEDEITSPELLSEKEGIVNFVNSNEHLTEFIGDNIELKNLVAQVLLSMIEDEQLEAAPQTLNPSIFSSYLEFQEQSILSSELYKEIDVAREVYHKYWVRTWEILHNNSEFSNIMDMSEQSWSGEEGRAEYDISYVWSNILEIHLFDSTFNTLRAEYPQIPYGFSQFKKMVMAIGGLSKFYHPIENTPIIYDLGGETVIWEPAILSFLSDKDIVTMLNEGNFMDISALSIARSSEDEISLPEQLNALMVQLETISETKEAIEDKLLGKSYGETDAIPLPAVLRSDTFGFVENIPLSLYLIKVSKGQWKVVDFSMPIYQTPTYTGYGSNDREAILNALEEFGQDAAYPEGDIIAEGPKEFLGVNNRIKVYSTGENWKQETAGDLSLMSAISGVLGLILVFTPLAPLGIGLLFVSGVSGATAAGLRISDRIEHETFEWNTETMLDVIDIVSGAIVAGKIANTALKVTKQAAKGAKVTMLVKGVETGADAATVVLIGNDYMQKLEEVEQMYENKEINEQERDDMRSAILQEASAVGLLLLVGYAGPKVKRKFGKSRSSKQASSSEGPDPNWKSTQTGNTSKNSKILRENLGLQVGDGKDAHHIVPGTHPKAEEARQILDEYQIDINSKENGIGLTTGQHQKTGLHKHKNIDAINDRIVNAKKGINDWFEARNEILEELSAIKNEIKKGLFP